MSPGTFRVTTRNLVIKGIGSDPDDARSSYLRTTMQSDRQTYDESLIIPAERREEKGNALLSVVDVIKYHGGRCGRAADRMLSAKSPLLSYSPMPGCWKSQQNNQPN